MNIKTDTEPLGSEHQAEGLAQRALELANEIEPVRDYKIKKLTLWNPAAAEIVEILRAYAEIAPKWQAVLDAEPVGEAYSMPAANGGITMACFDGVKVPIGTKLIIKPTA